MADNEELITKGLKIVRRVLVPYVVSELKNAYGDRWWQEGVYAILYNDRRQDYPDAAPMRSFGPRWTFF